MFIGSEYERLLEETINESKLKCVACYGETKIVKCGDRYTVKCRWSKCRRRVSSLDGLKSYKMPIAVQLALLDYWLMGMAPRLICRVFKISSSTFTRLLKRVMNVAVPRFYAREPKIGGNSRIVEIDEAKFGKRKHNRGHTVEGVWILGMAERSLSRRIILLPVENRSHETLFRLGKRHIRKESIIYTDKWRGYLGFDQYFTEHSSVNHSVEFVNSETGVHTNTIEGNWSSVRAGTPFRGRTRPLVSRYLLRYMLKRNYKNNELRTLIKLLLS